MLVNGASRYLVLVRHSYGRRTYLAEFPCGKRYRGGCRFVMERKRERVPYLSSWSRLRSQSVVPFQAVVVPRYWKWYYPCTIDTLAVAARTGHSVRFLLTLLYRVLVLALL